MSTSYENAPATKLLATSCLCCLRPLLDATSIETGMGPHCRKTHGYNKPDVAVELDAACEVCASLPAEIAASILLNAKTTRDLANRIVYRAAALRSASQDAFDPALFAAYVRVLAGIGFQRLSATIGKSIASASLTDEGELRAPYSTELLDALKGIPGRVWDRAAKAHFFHRSSVALVAHALVKAYGADALIATSAGLKTAGELSASLPVAEQAEKAPESETKPSVRVAWLDRKLVLHVPYDANAVACLKSLIAWDRRKWDASGKAWVVASSEKANLRRVLERHYAGQKIEIVDPSGASRIEQIAPALLLDVA